MKTFNFLKYTQLHTLLLGSNLSSYQEKGWATIRAVCVSLDGWPEQAVRYTEDERRLIQQLNLQAQCDQTTRYLHLLKLRRAGAQHLQISGVTLFKLADLATWFVYDDDLQGYRSACEVEEIGNSAKLIWQATIDRYIDDSFAFEFTPSKIGGRLAYRASASKNKFRLLPDSKFFEYQADANLDIQNNISSWAHLLQDIP